jgi:hypothetical protein
MDVKSSLASEGKKRLWVSEKDLLRKISGTRNEATGWNRKTYLEELR